MLRTPHLTIAYPMQKELGQNSLRASRYINVAEACIPLGYMPKAYPSKNGGGRINPPPPPSNSEEPDLLIGITFTYGGVTKI